MKFNYFWLILIIFNAGFYLRAQPTSFPPKIGLDNVCINSPYIKDLFVGRLVAKDVYAVEQVISGSPPAIVNLQRGTYSQPKVGDLRIIWNSVFDENGRRVNTWNSSDDISDDAGKIKEFSGRCRHFLLSNKKQSILYGQLNQKIYLRDRFSVKTILKPLAGVKITATDIAYKTKVETLTDKNGYYEFTNLAANTYYSIIPIFPKNLVGQQNSFYSMDSRYLARIDFEAQTENKEITGCVVDDKQKPLEKVRVVFYSADKTSRANMFLHTFDNFFGGTTSIDGCYRIDFVQPGDYQIEAIQELHNYAFSKTGYGTLAQLPMEIITTRPFRLLPTARKIKLEFKMPSPAYNFRLIGSILDRNKNQTAADVYIKDLTENYWIKTKFNSELPIFIDKNHKYQVFATSVVGNLMQTGSYGFSQPFIATGDSKNITIRLDHTLKMISSNGIMLPTIPNGK